MSDTHPFSIVVDGCTRKLKYADSTLLPLPMRAATRGATTLEPFEDPNSAYRFNYIVHVGKHRLGTLGIKNIKAVVDAELVSFRYDNATLYRDHVSEVLQFLSDFELSPANVTKMEVAVDTNEPLFQRFLDCFMQPESYHYHYSPTTLDKLRIAGEMYRDGTQNITLYPQIAEDKKAKCYNKTLDIIAKGKHYITDYHRLNGLDTTRRVDRFEIVLLNTAFKSKVTEYVKGDTVLSLYHYKKLPDAQKRGYTERVTEIDTTPTIEDMVNPEKLLSLFYKYTNNLRAFSRKCGTTRPSRCETVTLLHIGTPKPVVSTEYYQDPKTYKIQMTATYKTLIRHYYATQDSDYLATATKLAKSTGTQSELEKQLQALGALRHLYNTGKTDPTPANRPTLPL